MRTEETMAAEKIRRKPFVTLLGNCQDCGQPVIADRSSFAQIMAFSMRFASMISRTLSVRVAQSRIRGSKTNCVVDAKAVYNAGSFRSMQLLFLF